MRERPALIITEQSKINKNQQEKEIMFQVLVLLEQIHVFMQIQTDISKG